MEILNFLDFLVNQVKEGSNNKITNNNQAMNLKKNIFYLSKTSYLPCTAVFFSFWYRQVFADVIVYICLISVQLYS